MASNVNILGIIGIIGAILMIVSVFLTWAELDLVFFKGSATGWDIFSDSNLSDMINYSFTPLVALISGIVALVAMILPTFANSDNLKKTNNILGIISLLIAIVVIVLGILFMTQSWDLGVGTVSMMSHIAFGFWLTLIGAIIVVIGGIMPIVKNKMS
jgi:hypothetical protein